MKVSVLHSMTGFGRGAAAGERFQISIEIRAVNGRFFEMRAKIPRALQSFETFVREECAKKLKRGAVDLTLTLQSLRSTEGGAIDFHVAQAFSAEISQLAQELNLSSGLSAANLLRLPGVIAEKETESLEKDKEVAAILREALGEALDQLLDMRRREGEKLERVVQRELSELRSHSEWIAKHREDLNDRYFRKLENRLKEWSERTQARIDESRLYQEVAFYLDRSDVAEELDRLASHLKQCEDAVKGSANGSIGKRLEFLAQELGREVNTIGSKNDHAQVTTHVVEMKLAIERLREQVQNVE